MTDNYEGQTRYAASKTQFQKTFRIDFLNIKLIQRGNIPTQVNVAISTLTEHNQKIDEVIPDMQFATWQTNAPTGVVRVYDVVITCYRRL